MLLRVQNFCYFFNLRSGTFIFLWSVLVLSIILSCVGLFVYKSQFGGLTPVVLEHVSSLFLPFWLYFILLFGILPYGAALYGVCKKKLFYVELCVFMNIFALVSWVVTLVVFVLLLIFSELPSTSIFVLLVSLNSKVTESALEDFMKPSMTFQFPDQENWNRVRLVPTTPREPKIFKPIEFKLYMWICIGCLTVLIALKWYLTSVIHSYHLLLKQERRRPNTIP